MRRKAAYAIMLPLLAAQTLSFAAIGHAETPNTAVSALESQILSRIVPPTFPNRDFDIGSYGAVGDGVTDNTSSIQQAIDAATQAGGGRVVVPDGTYLSGAITLKSNVNLYLTKGATIKFSQDPNQYPLVLTQDGGIEIYNYSPFIYAYEAENIAITGAGTLDGQADSTHWWPWKSLAGPDGVLENTMADNNVPVEQRIFGKGHYIRPVFIQPYKSKNILIQGVTLLNSPNWQISPALSENVTVDGVNVWGSGPARNGPNTDGVDPEQTKNVLIQNSFFICGDDDIAIKSGKNTDGRRIGVSSENIVIRGNHFANGHGGITIGSEVSGSIRNVVAENNTLDSPNLDVALRFKTNSVRGGTIENIYFSNNTVNSLSSKGSVISVDEYYGEGDAGPFTPTIQNVAIDHLISNGVGGNGGMYGLYIRAYDRTPIANLRITDSSFANVATPMLVQNVKDPVFSNFSINGKPYNAIPLATSASLTAAQPDGLAGWYVHPVTAALTGMDLLSGNSQTAYNLDGKTWTAYSAPLTFSSSGFYTLQYRTTDRDAKGNIQNIEAFQTLPIHVDVQAPTIQIAAPVTGSVYQDAQDLTPIYTITDDMSGVDQSKTAVTIDGESVSGATIPLYSLPLGEHSLRVSATDAAGNVSSQTATFQTTTSVDSLKALVTSFTNSGWIDSAGIGNSLQSKLNQGGLREFIHEVQAQKEKHISTEAANYLLRDAEYLASST